MVLGNDALFESLRADYVGIVPWVITDSQAVGELINISGDASALAKLLAKFGADFVKAGTAQADGCAKALAPPKVRKDAADFMAQFTNHKALRSDAPLPSALMVVGL